MIPDALQRLRDEWIETANRLRSRATPYANSIAEGVEKCAADLDRVLATVREQPQERDLIDQVLDNAMGREFNTCRRCGAQIGSRYPCR